VQLDSFTRLLGPVVVKNPRDSYTESLWVKKLFYVQAFTTSTDKVIAYSITTRSAAFHPTFSICASNSPPVTLGRTTFSQLGQPRAVYADEGVHFGEFYSEFYGGIGMCSGRHYVLSSNSPLGYQHPTQGLNGDWILPLLNASGTWAPEIFGFEDNLGIQQSRAATPDGLNYWKGTFAPERDHIFVNTYAVTYSNSNVFRTYPELAQSLFGPWAEEPP